MRVPGLDRPIRLLGGLSQAQAVALLALAGLLALVVATFVVVHHSARLYLSADAGHYLADADALFGNGVRPSRHLPVFPFVLGLLQFVAGDLVAVVLAMGAVVLVLAAGFYVFVRGRLGAPAAELVGVVAFVLSPVLAEGISWYGASMMLGLGLSLFAMRVVDEALTRPTPGYVVGAGLLCGLVGLTHPLTFLLLAEVCALVGGALVLAPLLTAGRAGLREVGRRTLTLAGIAAVTATMVAPAATFYTSLQTPASVAFDPGRLAELPDWAFREDPWVWVPLLLGGVLLLIPGGRALNGHRGLRLGVWGATVGVVSVANLVLGGGHESYTTRYAYALPITIGAATAVAVALLWRVPPTVGRAGRRAVHGLVAVAVGAFGLQVGHSYFRRLTVAVPYYNLLTADEQEAIRSLDGQPGTVAVSAKGGDKVAGALYAWMTEGLAHVHALGTAEGFVNLLEEANAESADVERLVAGSGGVESGRLRISASEGTSAPIEVQGRVGGDWFPLVTLAVGPERAERLPVATVEVTSLGDRGGLRVDYGTLEVRVAMGTDRAPGGSDLAIDVVRVGEVDAVVVEVEAPPFAIGVSSEADSNRGTLSRTVGQTRVGVRLEADLSTRVNVEEDARAGTSRLHMEGSTGAVHLQLHVDGLDEESGPVTSWRDRDIIARRDFRYVYTWRITGLPPVLATRTCFAQALANDEVVVFAVLPECQAFGAAR